MSINPLSLLDTGSAFVFGKDYFIYLCIDGDPEIVISLNDTFPDGSTALTSRRIGGFHYGTIRKVSDDGLYIPIDSTGTKFGSSGTKWQDNVTVGIIPNSVWDLVHRPKVLHPGLVEVNGLWMGIYQASAEETFAFMSGTNNLPITAGKLTTKYGALPVTGTEGLSQFNFNEAAHKIGMRLPRYHEWLSGAFGSPQGEDGSNNYGWTKTSNTGRTYTGCSVNTSTGAHDTSSGVKPYAVSAYNLVDCAGNVWEWLSDYTIRQDSTSWTMYDVLGSNQGKAYLPNSIGFTALICGGYWSGGVICGPRAVHLPNVPWFVDVSIGARLVCDAA